MSVRIKSVLLTCDYCGKRFHPLDDWRKRKNHFHSVECFRLFKLKPIKPLNVKCAECGAPIVIKNKNSIKHHKYLSLYGKKNYCKNCTKKIVNEVYHEISSLQFARLLSNIYYKRKN